MSFFSNNRISGISSIEVEEAVGYEGVMGAQLAMVESVENDYRLFTGALMGDFQEACMIHEGESSEAVAAFQEGVISDMWNKLKELFKKLWAKIKAVFHAFIAKFQSVFMKSSKEFIRKYEKEIAQKDLSKMKAKYSARKNNNFKKLIELEGKIIDVVVDKPEEAEKTLENFETEDETLVFINKLVPGKKFNDLKTFAKDFHEECFEDEEEVEGFDKIKFEIITILNDSDKRETTINKAKSNLEKTISNIIKDIDAASKKNLKDYPTDEEGAKKPSDINIKWQRNSSNPGEKDKVPTLYNAERKDHQTILNLASKKASCAQAAINKLTAAVIAEHKFDVAQARRIAAKAVAYRKAKNESVLLNAIEEAAFYEAMDELK